MCGRYTIFADENHAEMYKIIGEIEAKYGPGAVSIGEIFPTNKAPVLAGTRDNITPQVMAWGFPQYSGTGRIINARAETAAEKPTFQKALESRRCIIPTTGFFEWQQVAGQKKKTKYLFTLAGCSMVYLAGLFDPNNRYYVILTTKANEAMQPYHHRMPVIIAPDEVRDWIGNNGNTSAYLNRTPPPLTAAKA